MPLMPPMLVDKHCLIYCGPERCNCIAGNTRIGEIGMERWRDPSTGEPVIRPEPTTAGFPAPPARSPLSAYTDDEIAAEYHRRALAKLGDQRVSVGIGPNGVFVSRPDCNT